MRVPPVGTDFSVLNLRCDGQEKFFGLGLSELILSEDRLERAGSGQSIISVLCVAGENFANDMMGAVLLRPVCRTISDFGEATIGRGVSCWVLRRRGVIAYGYGCQLVSLPLTSWRKVVKTGSSRGHVVSCRVKVMFRGNLAW